MEMLFSSLVYSIYTHIYIYIRNRRLICILYEHIVNQTLLLKVNIELSAIQFCKNSGIHKDSFPLYCH